MDWIPNCTDLRLDTTLTLSNLKPHRGLMECRFGNFHSSITSENMEPTVVGPDGRDARKSKDDLRKAVIASDTIEALRAFFNIYNAAKLSSNSFAKGYQTNMLWCLMDLYVRHVGVTDVQLVFVAIHLIARIQTLGDTMTECKDSAILCGLVTRLCASEDRGPNSTLLDTLLTTRATLTAKERVVSENIPKLTAKKRKEQQLAAMEAIFTAMRQGEVDAACHALYSLPSRQRKPFWDRLVTEAPQFHVDKPIIAELFRIADRFKSSKPDRQWVMLSFAVALLTTVNATTKLYPLFVSATHTVHATEILGKSLMLEWSNKRILEALVTNAFPPYPVNEDLPPLTPSSSVTIVATHNNSNTSSTFNPVFFSDSNG